MDTTNFNEVLVEEEKGVRIYGDISASMDITEISMVD